MTFHDTVRRTLEENVAKKRFGLTSSYRTIVAEATDATFDEHYNDVSSLIGKVAADRIFEGIIRFAYLIEPVKSPKIETTKYETRWGERIDPYDPRHASFDICSQMFDKLTQELLSALSDENKTQLLKIFGTRATFTHVMPIDYRERRLSGKMHRPDNAIWLWDSLPQRVIKLRSFLFNKQVNPFAKFFNLAFDKVKTKTYLTDRALTGLHKTNREKRWEAHPSSVQFALRHTCMEIEYELVNQLCHFAHTPQDLITSLEAAGLLEVRQRPARCPITLDTLSFEEFEHEVTDPAHGEAGFQVGHLNPLKAEIDDPNVGHTARNISWVSSDGNRIQGHLSLAETRTLLRRISENYEQLGMT